MSADNGTYVANLNFLAHTLDCFFQFKSTFFVVGMSDKHNVILVVFTVTLQMLDKRRYNVAFASDFADVYKMTAVINAD